MVISRKWRILSGMIPFGDFGVSAILSTWLSRLSFSKISLRKNILEPSKEEAEGKMVQDSTRTKFRKIGPLGRLHNIVVHIRSSPSRTQEFKDLMKRTIPLDNRTRWNSWYKMLEVSDQMAGALDTYSKNHFETLQKDYLLPR